MSTTLPWIFDPAIHQVLSNVSVALDLAQSGVAVFPCQAEGANAKCPMPGLFWRNQSTTDVRRIEQWWERWPDAIPAIDLAKSDFVVIDCDGEFGLSDWTAVAAGRAPNAPTVRSPRGGEHVYFRRKGRNLGNSTGSLPPKRVGPSGEKEGLDVRGAGGYVIAPCATMLDGRRYEPSDVSIHHADEVPDWLLEILVSQRHVEATAQPVLRGAPVSDERKRLYGERALMEEMASLASKGVGERNEAANKIAFRIGQLVGGGCLTEAEAYSHLHNAAASWGIPANDKALGPRGTIMRGIRAGAQSPRFCPEDDTSLADAYAAPLVKPRDVIRAKDGSLADATTGEILPPSTSGPGDVLDSLSLGKNVDWTYPGGLIEEMAEYILSSARRPNRPLAVAAAAAVLSTVCGRHLYAPSGTALNLYVVCLAGTTVGKGRPFSAVAEILKAAGLEALQTTAKGFSVSSIERMMVDHPSCVATIDEIGANLLGRMSNKNSNSHEQAMRGALLELWSREQGQDGFYTHRRALEASVEIPSPSLTLFGASTSEAFYGAVTSGSVKDGFLNRFLLAHAAPRAKSCEVSQEARVVPQSIIQRLLHIIPNGTVNLQAALSNFTLAGRPDEVRMEWDSFATKARSAEFEEEILDVMDANPEHAPLMGRVFEYSMRLAALRAVSRGGRAARVGMQDLEWGAAWAVSSAKAMINGAGAQMAASDYEEKFNAVRNALQEAKVLARRELLRRVRSVSARERDDIIKHLKEGGWIEEISLPTAGRQAVGWRWIG